MKTRRVLGVAVVVAAGAVVVGSVPGVAAAPTGVAGSVVEGARSVGVSGGSSGASGVSGARVSVGPGAQHPGGKVTVAGSGFVPGGVVTVRLGSASSRVAADRGGRFSVRVLVPWQTVPGMVAVSATQGATRATATLRVGVDWRIPGLNRARSFVNPYEKQLTRGSVTGLGVVGRFAVTGPDADNTFAWFATLGDAAYACTLDGDVARFDLSTRKVVWLTVNSDSTGTQFCSGDGGPYLAPDGTVWLGQLRYNGATGESTYGVQNDATVPYGDHLIGLGTRVGAVPFGVDPTTGKILWWAYDTGGLDSLITSAGVLYDHDGQTLYATDPDNGRTLWTRPFDQGGISLLASNGKALLAFTGRPRPEGGVNLARLDPDTGNPTWAIDITEGFSSGVTVDADRAYLIRSLTGPRDQNLVGVDLSGKQVWATPLSNDEVLLDTFITEANGILYVPLYGALRTFDAATGQLLDTVQLRDPNGDKVVPGRAIVDDGHVYVTSTTGVYDLTLT